MRDGKPYELRDHSRVAKVELKTGIPLGEVGACPIESEIRLLSTFRSKGIVLHIEKEHRIVKERAIPVILDGLSLITEVDDEFSIVANRGYCNTRMGINWRWFPEWRVD